MSKELSNIENNLALLVALNKAMLTVTEDLADQYTKLVEVSMDFKPVAQTWEQSGQDIKSTITIMETALEALDATGKVREFLESHMIHPVWMEKS